MFRRARVAWLRARAMAVLQIDYGMPLKEPVEGLENADLKHVINACLDTGGNEFDAAAAYMTLRIKSSLQVEAQVGYPPNEEAEDFEKLILGLARTLGRSKFRELHMKTLHEIKVLRDQTASQPACGSLG